MASDSSTNNSSKPSTPFEWLSGGLFFGKAKQGIEGIDSTKDVLALLNGVQQNLAALVQSKQHVQQQQHRAAAGALAAPSDTPHSPPPPGSGNNHASNEDESSDPSKFLAARLSRIRFLLYDERRLTSQQYENPSSLSSSLSRRGSSTPAVAGCTLQSLTSESNDRNPLNRLLPQLLEHMGYLPFESRKHVAAIFNYLMVAGLEGRDADLYKPVMIGFREYVALHYETFLTVIVQGHEQDATSGDIALHFGSMYRACLRHSELYQQLVGTSDRAARYVFPFLDTFVHYSNFDVASDAMESVRLVFLAGGDKITDDASAQEMAVVTAEFLTRDYEEVWDQRFNPKLLSTQANYMTRRVALQILSAVLLTRTNYNVMIRYVDSRTNLILIMDLLRDTSPHITLDAWQVFKVFVANPNKPQDIIKILQDNKIKLCRYLETLHHDREESDTQFRDEKALIIATIDAL